VSAVVFLGASRTKAATRAHDSGPLMRGSMVALAAGCVVLGLAPALFWPALGRAVGAWNPDWAATVPPALLATLGFVQVALALVIAVVVMWLWRRARHNGLNRALTWDCGYATPTARMQYTGGSFAGIGAGWFFWILRPERTIRRPRGTFPIRARRMERVPETVLEHVIAPAGSVVMRVSTAVRRLQHGRLQSYILYLLAGLIALAAFVVIGVRR
jgi:hydrogenase-4 component B